MRRSLLVAAAAVVAVGAAGTWWWLADDGATYTVVGGDTLWGIARDHGVSVAELKAWNGLTGDALDVGDRLRVGPSDGSEPNVATRPSNARRPRQRQDRRVVQAPKEPVPGGPAALTMPRPEPCVPFTADPGEEGMVAPEGLSPAQARAALDPVLQEALACMPDADVDRVALLFELNVGCDGVVSRVDVLDPGGASARYAGCVADVLRHADFPAHDLPDGETITYPVTVEW